MKDHSLSERKAILAMIETTEDWKPGVEYSVNQLNAINNAKSISSSLNKPIVSGFDSSKSSNFLDQTNKVRSQPQTVNNKMDISVGDINVNTTASTVSGVSSDAAESIVARVYQMVPSLS
jgi:hypothetical protein